MQPVKRFLALALGASLLFSAAPAGAAEIIRSISFSDADHGYMSGVLTSPSGSKGFISSTVNGGTSWTPQWLPGNTDVVSVAAGDGANALAVSSFMPTPFRTTNGGVAWTPTPAGPLGSDMNFAGVERFSGGRIVAVGKYTGSDGGGTGTYGVIATSAQGTSWTKPFYGPAYPADGELPIKATNADMRDVDTFGAGTYGWAIGNERTPDTGGDSATHKQILIYKTSNGGVDWVKQNSTVLLNGLSMKSVVAVSDQVAYTVGNSGVILKTINGGTTWTAKVVSNLSLNAVDAVNATTAVAVGDQGWIAKTIDGGATWTTKQTSLKERLWSVAVVTPTKWIAVGDGNSLYRTTDAGANWVRSTVTPPPPVVPRTNTTFTSVSSSKYGLAYGTSTAITATLKTTAGANPGVQLVYLQRSGNGTSGWTTIASADTAPSGAVKFTIPASSGGYNYSKAYFRLVFNGASAYAPTTGAVRVVDPKAKLGTPKSSKSTVYAKRTYTWSSTISPRHAAGSAVLKLQFQRKVGSKYKAYKTVTAYATTYSSSTSVGKAKYKLPYKGKWRVRAFHDDGGHAPTYSSWLYKTAK